jgi:hypothetical protein
MKALTTLTILISSVLVPHHLPFMRVSGHVSPGAGQPRVSAPFVAEEVPTVAFCEMVKNPQPYFDKAVRLTALITLPTEGIYLNDDKCVPDPDDKIGVGFIINNEKQRDMHNRNIRIIRSSKYGSRAQVTVVGILRNSPSRNVFAPHRYRFDIISYEDISHMTVTYKGVLQEGTAYRAEVRGGGPSGLSLVVPVRAQEHVAVSIVWVNLGRFPALQQMRDSGGQREIVFSVVSDRTKQMTERRWNRVLECEILSVK